VAFCISPSPTSPCLQKISHDATVMASTDNSKLETDDLLQELNMRVMVRDHFCIGLVIYLYGT